MFKSLQVDLPSREEHRLLELDVKSRDDDAGERLVQKWVALQVLVQQALKPSGLVLGPIQGHEFTPCPPSPASTLTHTLAS